MCVVYYTTRFFEFQVLTSTGTLLAFACLITSASALLESGDGLPPVLTAIIIFFPNTALVFAFLASVFDFVAARTAAARPMNKAFLPPGLQAGEVVVKIPERVEKEFVCGQEQSRSAAKYSRSVGLFIGIFLGVFKQNCVVISLQQ